MKKIKLSLAGLPKMGANELKNVKGGEIKYIGNGMCYDTNLGLTFRCRKCGC
jgi:hypothetical protein